MHPLPLAITGAATLAGSAIAYATMAPSSQWFGPTLLAGPDPSEIALTFDDGPNGDTTLRLLEKLARYNIRATFFLVGKYVLAQPAIARQVAAAGHTIGNHTMTHPRLLALGPAATRTQMVEAGKAIADTTGVETKLFRPPFGGRWPHTLTIARELGLRPILWNATGRDWSVKDPAVIASRLLAGIHHNRECNRASNLLLHDGSHTAQGANREPTLAAMDRLIKAEGPQSKFVTIAQWI